MPTIAQKLCEEIVDPILAPSSQNLKNTLPLRRSLRLVSGNSTKLEKPSRSIVIEKKKVTSQIEPSSKTVIDKIKSKETVLNQHLIDTGVNTLISGPLKNDNNCITNVRRRENQCSCKYGHKKIPFKTCSRQAQTALKSCSQFDKACSQSITTNNCGTQFMENLNSMIKTQISNRLLVKKSYDLEPQVNYRNIPQQSSKISNQYSTNRVSKMMCQNAKRWALSNYHTRGPDF